MNASGREGRLVAVGVVVVLVALVVVGRLQARNLAEGDAGMSRVTRGTVATDDAPVGSGLAVAGRVALPDPPVAVVVGAGAVWVLLEQGTLLRAARPIGPPKGADAPMHQSRGKHGAAWPSTPPRGHDRTAAEGAVGPVGW